MTGTLKVETIPPGASIEIDYTDTGKNTPYEFILTSGIHHWAVYLPQYQRMEDNITINDNEPHNLVVSLQTDLSIQTIWLIKVGLVLSGIAVLANILKNK